MGCCSGDKPKKQQQQRGRAPAGAEAQYAAIVQRTGGSLLWNFHDTLWKSLDSWHTNWISAKGDFDLSANLPCFNRWTVKIRPTLQRTMQTEVLHRHLLPVALHGLCGRLGCDRGIRVQEWRPRPADHAHRFAESQVRSGQFGAE